MNKRASEHESKEERAKASVVVRPYSFKNLDFYQQARSLAVDIFKIARRFPKDDATRVVTRQVVAAATSIRANIAEGHGRYSRAAYRNHLSIARGSTTETADWADFLLAVGLISEEEEQVISARCQRIIASLTRAMRRLSDTASASSPRIAEGRAQYGIDEPFDPNADGDFDDDPHES